MLTDVGLPVELQLTDMATYLKHVQSDPDKQPLISFGRWSCACQDVDGLLFPLLHSSSSWSSLRNPDIDKLLDTARNTLDEKPRLDAYKQVSEFVSSDVPLVPLYQAAAV